MSESLTEMRQRLHELVKDGEILEAIKECGRYYGFNRLGIIPDSRSFAVKTTTVNSGEFHTVEDTLYVGFLKYKELRQLAKIDARVVEDTIEFYTLNEKGHVFKPKNTVKIDGKTVPYSIDEIMAHQYRKGMDVDSKEAYLQLESQADLYTVIKYHDGRTLDELTDGIATRVWTGSIYTRYDKFDNIEKELSAEVREAVVHDEALMFLGGKGLGYSYIKPETLAKIAEKVVEIDKDYRSKLAEVGK